MDFISFILPWPPSVNHCKVQGIIKTTSNGKMYQIRTTSAKTKNFYSCVREIALARNLNNSFFYNNSKNFKIAALIDFYPPDNRKRDIDNPIKILLDSLVLSSIIYDDSQIYRLNVVKHEKVKNGAVEVKLLKI